MDNLTKKGGMKELNRHYTALIQYREALERILKSPSMNYSKHIYLLIKYLGHIDFEIPYTEKDCLRSMLSVADQTFEMISCLTPRMFINIFPVDKQYVRQCSQQNDYFSTMDMINEAGSDTFIGANVKDFLAGYCNKDVNCFLNHVLSMEDALQKAAERKP